MHRRPDFVHPQNVVADTVSTRNIACCYDTSRVETNPAVYVSSQSGSDSANNGRSAASPVATFEKAVDVLNRIGAWQGEAVVHLMDTVAVSASALAGVQILRPKVGQARGVKVTGYQPTHATFRITDGMSPTPAPPTELDGHSPQWVQVTVSSTMTTNAHARKRYTITHPSTGEVATDGVVYANATTSFHLIDATTIDYTGYDLNVFDETTGVAPPKLEITGTDTSDAYHFDGDLPVVFSQLDLSSEYVRIDSHDPTNRIAFERVRWDVGPHTRFACDFSIVSSYLFSQTAGTTRSLVDSGCRRFDLARSWLHDAIIDLAYGGFYLYAVLRPVEYTIDSTFVDGVAPCCFSGAGSVVQSAFVNGDASTETRQIGGRVFFQGCGFSGTGVAPMALACYTGAHTTFMNCALLDSVGGAAGPVLYAAGNPSIHVQSSLIVLTAQHGGAAADHAIQLTEAASFHGVASSIVFAVDANVVATAELAVDTGSVAEIGSSSAVFGVGPTQIDWVDGGGPAAFPVVAGWQQNGSCRVATF